MSNSDRLTSQPGEKLPDLSMAQMVRKNAETYALTQTADIVMNKGFSAIFEALHSNYGAVAVKLVRTRRVPHYLWIPILVRDWMNEKGILSQLDHPSIVKLKGSDAQLYLYSLYLDFIPFRDLSRWRNRDNGHYFAGERGDARRVLDDMMAAVAHIKSRSIIHNDIKPSNILYDPIKGAILIDFGLAASSSNRKLCTGGTPWYVAPEYLSQRRGPESDEYALGVVMLYLLKAIPLPDTTEQ
ncbi:hypothetical protein CEP51_016427 [Fusarium floridanum]|uniref:Protein kinase domain-containing protein n=1 Tax=Fusarium floridanum TaxID=1325733 RepID=A0A428NQ12_9HYPO|nr:hypothetical protein CEP51_016427 [Fusarium floridanum]